MTGFLPSHVSGDISRRKVFCPLLNVTILNIQNCICANLRAFKILILFLLNLFFFCHSFESFNKISQGYGSRALCQVTAEESQQN